MAYAPDHPVIAVATSIPPRLVRLDAGRSIGDEYQRLCIRSWIDCGFRIVSVNDREEIPDLAGRYPEVTFVATDRNASAWSGRKNPYIADLLLALKDAPEPVLGIINSDLIFEPSSAWRTRLPSLVREAIVVGQRYNTISLLRGVFTRYYEGIDCFFFDRTIAREALEHAVPFAMGLPWWDFWLPCVAAFNNRRILVVDRPGVVHLVHRQAFTMTAWREFAHIFASFVIGTFESASHALPEFITTTVPICREIATLQREGVIDHREYFRRIRKPAYRFFAQIRKSVVCLESNELPASGTHLSDSADFLDPVAALGAALTVDNVFRRFGRRSAAGEALLRAMQLVGENRLVEAEPELLAAFNETPEDIEVLLLFGEFAFCRGEFQNAHLMLSKVTEQIPDSTRGLYLLGFVLHAMDRREEAIECFQKILHLSPQFQAAYIPLAKALWETKRQCEALALLERSMDRWPHFAGATELYDRFGKDFEANGVIPARVGQAQKCAVQSHMLRLFARLSGAISRIIKRPIRISPPSKTGGDK